MINMHAQSIQAMSLVATAVRVLSLDELLLGADAR